MRLLRRLLALGLSILAVAGCDIPRDPESTLDRVRGGPLRVGVIENPPWATTAAGKVNGIEARLVAALAKELGATVSWVQAPAPELMTALEHYQLDLVIGGLSKPNPWSRNVALSNAYYTDAIVVGIQPGQGPVVGIKGMAVAVKPGSAAAGYVRARGGKPVQVPHLDAARGPVATEAWRLAALGLEATAVQLHRTRHVVALPPGENAWRVYIEKFLHSRQAQIPNMLRQHEVGP